MITKQAIFSLQMNCRNLPYNSEILQLKSKKNLDLKDNQIAKKFKRDAAKIFFCDFLGPKNGD